jgi:2-succinyl-5-enolpyruvyl-6-hydroxy-3-cyclohexene-1-carboxylate synthase
MGRVGKQNRRPAALVDPVSEVSNLAWCRLIVEVLHEAGVRHWFLAPGARSAPLAYAASLQPGLEIITHYDERGAAFAALGSAQASGRPAVCLTTSGSAVAHLLPAAVEAWESGHPLLFLTADRPPSLRGTGANQTIVQPGLFGHFVRAEWDLPLPSAEAWSTLAEKLRQTVSCWSEGWSGPVHWNVPLAEPLLPPEEKDAGKVAPGERGATPRIAPAAVEEKRLRFEIPPWLQTLCASQRGVVVVGELSPTEQAAASELVGLAGHLGWPLLADPLSGLRNGVPGVVRHTDLLLQDQQWPQPVAVLHVGGRIVARRLQEWLNQVPGTAYAQIRRGPERLDPGLVSPQLVRGEIVPWVRSLIETIPAAWDCRWREQWLAADEAAAKHLQAVVRWPGEPALARRVVEWAASYGAGLFLGNSMPIRDVDAFAGEAGGRRVTVYGQRGASGIDGNLAHMAGLARCLDGPLFGLLGDLAVLHDLNSLPLLAGRRVILFVPNNGGGGIFSFLPLQLPAPAREKLLSTPHGFCLSSLVAPFGVRSRRCQSEEETKAFVEELLDPAPPPGPGLVEIPCDRGQNLQDHQKITRGWLDLAPTWRPDD